MGGGDLMIPKKGDMKIKIPYLDFIQYTPFKVMEMAVLHGFCRFIREIFQNILKK